MPKRTPRSPASFGWTAVAAVVIAFDTWAIRRNKETLSSAFWRAQGNPVGMAALSVIWGSLTYHLFLERRVGKYPFAFIVKIIKIGCDA